MTLIDSDHLAPIGRDLTQPGQVGMDIIKDLESALRGSFDAPFVEGDLFQEGDWAVLNSEGKAVAPGASAVANTFPVWCGNKDRYDAHASGRVTVLTGTAFIYRTSRFDTMSSYAMGDKLTVKGGNVLVPAGANDVVLARVFKPVEGGVLTVQVVRS